MYTKSLEGAVVERVYYAATVPAWLPVIGEAFEDFLKAREYVKSVLADKSNVHIEGVVEVRVVFRYPNGTQWDTSVDKMKVRL